MVLDKLKTGPAAKYAYKSAADRVKPKMNARAYFASCFIAIAYAYNCSLLIASNNPINDQFKGLIARVFAEQIYSTNVEHFVNIPGVLNTFTSSLQRDVIIDAINRTTEHSCNWERLFRNSAPILGRFVLFIVDSPYCGSDPFPTIIDRQTHGNIIRPVAVGSAVNMFQIMRASGPCPPPGCREGLHYIKMSL